MKKLSAWKLYFIGGTLIAGALLMGGQYISLPFKIPTAQASINFAPAVSVPQPAQKVSGIPIRIVVAGHDIDLPVIQGSYDAKSGNWTLTNDKAQFAVISSVANNRAGNTFIYGHDIPKVFKHLEQLVPGDTAKIITDSGYAFTYRYRTAIDVDPNNTSIFSYSGAPILTLQTCSGIWSQNRHLMTFDFVEVQKV